MTPTPPHSDALLAARNLRMVYPGGTVALDDVSVDLFEREFLVVLGSSGAGKSTLLRMLNRLGTPTGGSVLFRGDDVSHAAGRRLLRLRQGVGMIFQQFNLVGRLSVLHNVLAGRLRFARRPLPLLRSQVHLFSRGDRSFAMECLERVGVAHLARRRADTLSGGQQQRVAIARVLAQEPSVILADEPIASLDPRSAEVVMDILRDIHETRGLPVIANLHQVDHAVRYATRIVGMRAGRVAFSGAPGELDQASIESLYRANRASSLDDEAPGGRTAPCTARVMDGAGVMVGRAPHSHTTSGSLA